MAALTGLGWRGPHYDELLATRPTLPFLEVHSENFFAAGGAALARLQAARADYPISLHGVSLGLGSAIGVDEQHLDQLARLVQRIEPVRVSDHACFARAALGPGDSAAVHANDLLPLAFTPAALDILVANVQQVQERLQRPLLVENLSAYLAWADNSLDEAEFFNTLVLRSGCQLLLDVNNLVVNARNERAGDPTAQACAFVNALSRGSVGQIHLAGYRELGDVVIDDHGSRVHADVWPVYRLALQRFGAVPSLLEWDTELPALAVLLDEVCRCDEQAQNALSTTLSPAS